MLNYAEAAAKLDLCERERRFGGASSAMIDNLHRDLAGDAFVVKAELTGRLAEGRVENGFSMTT